MEGREDHIQSLRQHLVSTLRQQATEGSSSYEDLVQEIRHLLHLTSTADCPAERRKLRILLTSLAGCASEILPKHHFTLCNELLNTQFIDQPTAVQEALLEVFFGLMVTNCSMIPGCLSSMAISLVPFKAAGPARDLQVKWTPPQVLLEMQDRILKTVEKVTELIPNAASHFLSTLFAKQPFWMRHCESHCLYLRSIFEIMKLPMGRLFEEKLWSMALHHLLDLDVNIHSKDLHRSTDLSGDVGNVTIFSCDLEEGSTRAQDTPASIQLTTLLTVMDTLMELTLEQLESQMAAQKQSQMWQIMMILLDALLITTHEAQFTHFLVFYLAQRNPEEWVECLMKKCLAKVEDPWTMPFLRSSYTSYIASFLSRAKFVSEEMKMTCLETLLTICEQYVRKQAELGKEKEKRKRKLHLQEQEPSSRELIEKHEVFYVCMQAVMYLLCYMMPFHFQKKCGNEVHHEKLKSMIQGRLSPLLYHQLEPLNRVNPAVAVQFLDFTEQFNIIHCRHLINPAELYQEKGKLQTHFPFDPYCLGRSAAYLNLEETYMTWSEVQQNSEGPDSDMEFENEGEEKMMEGLSLEEDCTPGSSLPYYNSIGSSLKSDRL